MRTGLDLFCGAGGAAYGYMQAGFQVTGVDMQPQPRYAGKDGAHSMRKPKGLDLFCGAGGSSMGYHLAGFEMTGVDIHPQPHYPFRFIQDDALNYLAHHGHEYEAIFASPPCQGYSRLRHLPWLRDKTYPLYLPQVLALCQARQAPYVIENVEDAPLDGFVLCGRQFDLPLYRHRRFASNVFFWELPHPPHTTVICHGRRALAQRYRRGVRRDVTGTLGDVSAAEALGIHWMTRQELSQAIPPAYTEWIGIQLRNHLQRTSPCPDPRSP